VSPLPGLAGPGSGTIKDQDQDQEQEQDLGPFRDSAMILRT
jgi:hypothetical protein